jgi:hypothetical protein
MTAQDTTAEDFLTARLQHSNPQVDGIPILESGIEGAQS